MLMGVPEGMHGVLTTAPYYRSSYVFVTPTARAPADRILQRSPSDGRRLDCRFWKRIYRTALASTDPARPCGAIWSASTHSGRQGRDIVRAVATGASDAAVVWGRWPATSQPASTSAAVDAGVAGVDRLGLPFTFAMIAWACS